MALQIYLENGMRRVQKTVTIQRPAIELYYSWRHLGNLSRFMKHVQSVTTHDGWHSRWVERTPTGAFVSWDAVIEEDIIGERLAWRALREGGVTNAGEVRFIATPKSQGTEVSVTLDYAAPDDGAGIGHPNQFTEALSIQLDEDLHRFKELMETGRIVSAEGQLAAMEQRLKERWSFLRGGARPTPTTSQETFG